MPVAAATLALNAPMYRSALVSLRKAAKSPKKKPRFPGLSCERGTRLELATLSLGS
jgi:hypothetical protein